MHTRKHLLVPPDHRDDDSAPKCLELVILHLQARPRLTQRRVTLFLWQDGQIPTEHTKLKRMVHLVARTVCVIE
jgi:hypothetical protein